MKKLISAILLISTACALTFAAPKKEKAEEKNTNYIKLDPKKKFAIEGVELGTIDWANAKITNKGEIIWDQSRSDEWAETGWELRGIDMSPYAGLRIELAPGQKQDLRYEIVNPACDGNACGYFRSDGVAYVMFNGAGRNWGTMKNPDPEEGYLIKINGDVKSYKKTVIKSVELIKKEDINDASHLTILDTEFGNLAWQTHILGNEIIWIKGENCGDADWDFSGVDLSEYDRVRIEIESNNANGLGLRLCDSNHENWHGFNSPIEPNVWEAELTGENASWDGENATYLDKSKGVQIILQAWNEKPRTQEERTVIKSIQLLKGKRQLNENLKLQGVDFGSSNWQAYVYEGGIIDWQWNGKEKYPVCGWNTKGLDFSEWSSIRIEVESTDIPVEIRMYQNGDGKECHIGYNAVSPTILEAKLDGSQFSWSYPDGAKWDPSKGIDEIQVRAIDLKKEGLKTKIKSVTLLKAGEESKQPENLMLNGAKLGTTNWPSSSWLDDDFVINWGKEKYEEFGWKVEKLEGEILEIKVSETNVPLHLKIRDSHKNESEWEDDGTHLFRINLKTKKMLVANDKKKDPLWTSQTKAYDFSDGAQIMLVPANGVFKDGKKTVVEYIKVE